MGGNSERPQLIEYTHVNTDPTGLVMTDESKLWVQRIDASSPLEMVEEAAVGIQAVLLAAYSRRFEGEKPGLIAPGTFKRYRFDPEDPKKVADQVKNIRLYTEGGAQYFVTSANDPRNHEENPDIVGVAKISPSVPRVSRLLRKAHIAQAPNLFVNDIAVSKEREHVGAITLGAALQYGGYSKRAKMALHAFTQQTETNDWFERLGLRQTRELRHSFVVGPRSIGQALYVSGLGQNTTTALNYLRKKHPVVNSASPVRPLQS